MGYLHCGENNGQGSQAEMSLYFHRQEISLVYGDTWHMLCMCIEDFCGDVTSDFVAWH